MNTRAIIEIVLIICITAFSGRMLHLRSRKLGITLDIFVKVILLCTSIYFKYEALIFMLVMSLIGNIIQIIFIISWNNEQKEEQRREDERDGVVYCLKESEYKITD